MQDGYYEYVKDAGAGHKTTGVHFLHDAWWATWRGKQANIAFNSKGAAIAYLATCTRAGRLRG